MEYILIIEFYVLGLVNAHMLLLASHMLLLTVDMLTSLIPDEEGKVGLGFGMDHVGIAQCKCAKQ